MPAYLNALLFSGEIDSFWTTSSIYCSELYMQFGLLGESTACLEELFNSEQATEESRQHARLMLCSFSAMQGDPSRGAEVACKDLLESYSQDPTSLQPEELLSIAFYSHIVGDYAGTVAITKCLLDSCGIVLSATERINSLDLRARSQVALGRLEDAEKALSQAVRAAQELEDSGAKKLTLSSLLMQRGNLLRLLSLYSDALECLDQALTFAEQQSDIEELIYSQYVQTYLLAGRPDDAEEKLDSFRAVQGNLPPTLKAAAAYLWEGHIAYLRRDLPVARKILATVEAQLSLLQTSQLHPEHSKWIENMVDTVVDFRILLASESSDMTEAIRLQELLVDQFERRMDVHEETTARTALARLLSAAGDVERAEQGVPHCPPNSRCLGAGRSRGRHAIGIINVLHVPG